jgi:hypothetical protein
VNGFWSKKLSLEMKHGVISLKQMTQFAMETATIPTTQESSHVEITDEENTPYFL